MYVLEDEKWRCERFEKALLYLACALATWFSFSKKSYQPCGESQSYRLGGVRIAAMCELDNGKS